MASRFAQIPPGVIGADHVSSDVPLKFGASPRAAFSTETHGEAGDQTGTRVYRTVFAESPVHTGTRLDFAGKLLSPTAPESGIN